MTTKRVIGNGRDFIFPVFKFQKAVHAESMWKNGNIHLSKISNFRANHSGKIKDPREGQVTLLYPVDEKANYNFIYKKTHIEINEAMIFCTSSNFLSGTLKWALSEEGKDNCVLITDLAEVNKRVSSVLDDYNFIGSGKCIYSGRDISLHPFTDNNLGTSILNNHINAAWVKPEEYKEQSEIRSLWYPKELISTKSSINKNIEIHDFLIPIEHSGLDALFTGNGHYTIAARAVTKDGLPDAWFEVNHPSEIFTPVIHKDNEEYLIGFLSPSPTVSRARFHGGQTGVAITEIGIIGCNVYLKDIIRIEYHLQP